MNWQLRPWQLGDLATLAAIEIASHAVPSWSPRHFAERFQMQDVGTVGVAANGEIAGFAVLWLVHAASEAHLLNVAVLPAYWGQGLGQQLLTRAIDQAQRHWADVMFLEVRKSNRRAQRLYEMAGFYEIGLRTHYYPARPPHPAEDAIVMARALQRRDEFP